MKQTGKLTILMVAVVAIGIFALPSIMSVGAGQHTFTNATSIKEGMDNSKNCLRCHGTQNDDVSGELGRSDLNDFYNLTGGVGMGKIHSKVQCGHCHDSSRASESVANSHTKVPSKPLCKACHNGVGTVQGIALSDVWGNLSQSSDAHTRFANDTLPNAGCLGCHTRVAIGGEVSYSYTGMISQLGLDIGDNGGKPTPYTAP